MSEAECPQLTLAHHLKCHSWNPEPYFLRRLVKDAFAGPFGEE